MNGDILNIARVEYHTGQPQFTSPWAEQLEASKSADLVESSVELAANSSDKCERTSAFQSCIDIKELLKGPERLWVVFYASCVASIGSIVLGYAVGNTSPLTLQLQNEDYQRNVSRAAFTKLHSDIFGVSYDVLVNSVSIKAMRMSVLERYIQIASQYCDS